MSGAVERQRARKAMLQRRLAKIIDGWRASGADPAALHRALKSFSASMKVPGVDVDTSAQEIMKYVDSEKFNAAVHAGIIVNRFAEGDRLDAALRKSTGGRVYKRWRTVDDERVRDEHDAVNGELVPVDEPFEVGGYLMMHPGDESLGAPFDLIVNCRCTVEYVTK